MLKLNIGCGHNKAEGYTNVDKFPECSPDMVMDAEVFPWPFDTSSVDEVLFNHSLEHMGANADVFLRLMQELYRVCKPDATVQINVPHPRHDNFIGDPTHVRIISPQVLSLFSKKNNEEWRAKKAANTTLALYLGVDFEVENVSILLEERYMDMLNLHQTSQEMLILLSEERNNVIAEYHITVKVRK